MACIYTNRDGAFNIISIVPTSPKEVTPEEKERAALKAAMLDLKHPYNITVRLAQQLELTRD